MQTEIAEIADGIYRLSTYVSDIAPPAGFTFNQYLVCGEQSLLFHTGPRALFPLVQAALARVLPGAAPDWLSFGHFEADECGAMNDWLAHAPRATVAHGQTGCMVSLTDVAARPPRALTHGEVLELGAGKRLRWFDTPHLPHGWDAGLMFEESTGTLLCGDLFTQIGRAPASSDGDIIGPAIAAEDLFRSSSLHPDSARLLRELATLAPTTLALMHGPAWRGDGAAALQALAEDYQRRCTVG